MDNIFDTYFKALQAHPLAAITEHSLRGELKALLIGLANKNTRVLHEPKREGKFGSPDFKITNTESIIGYVENKKIGEDLDKVIKSSQIIKYQALSDNILVTNYTEWIWLREGKIQQREILCFTSDVENKRAKLNTDKVIAVTKLLTSFLSQPPTQITDTRKLAEALALRAKLLKDFLKEELERQAKVHTEGRLYQLYETFKNFIFQELSIEEFADAFAQNLVYGLFLAKLNAGVETINLYNAKKFIPLSFDLIRELVNFLDELDNEEYHTTRWIVEEVLTIMNHLDLKAIQHTLSFTSAKKDAEGFQIKDPYVYFYEDFLAAYDKKLRKSRGVYYTPPQVVNFIVRAIDDVLKNILDVRDGLADRHNVTVLDFATGTGTFLVEVLQQIFNSLPVGSGKKNLLIRDHILKNIYGFEYLIAPYTIAHLKLSQFLNDNEYELKGKERLQIYLTNTLEPVASQIKIPLMPALTEDSRLAQEVKDKPILVITGNPPYSYISKNPSQMVWYEERKGLIGIKKVKKTKLTWIGEKINDYKFIDGKKINEKNPKGLQDDYVKFIRFAQDKIEKVEQGVVGIITNHRFLTNPTFNGMRRSLMETFDLLYFLDLHGSNKPKEFSPNNEIDENVFDIEQGVAISFFVKKKGIGKKVFHADFWGSRNSKNNLCTKESLDSINWVEILPTAPFFLFEPQNEILKNHYETFISVNEIFKENSVGVVTSNDELFTDFNFQNLKTKILEKYNTCESSLIKPYNYSPFDQIYIYYDKSLIDRPREKVMSHLLSNNYALIISKQVKADFKHIFVSNGITAKNFLDSAGSFGAGNIFPINLFVGDTIVENFKQTFREKINNKYASTTATEIVSYIYAILYSPTYRKKYAEFLKGDFPRIPFTEDKNIFNELTLVGKDLIDAHLLKRVGLNKPLGDFLGKGDNVVEKVTYNLVDNIGRLYINNSQYFNNVPQNVYDFYIGGYQVLEKHLKDRKNKELTTNEVENLELTIKTIAYTIEQMVKIDKLTFNWI